MRIQLDHDKADNMCFWLMAADRALIALNRNDGIQNHIAKLMHCMADGMTPQEAADWCATHRK